jgi:hypothetical protein
MVSEATVLWRDRDANRSSDVAFKKLTTLLLCADLSVVVPTTSTSLERVERSAVVSHHTTCSQPYGEHELRALARSAFAPSHLDRAIARAVQQSAGARIPAAPGVARRGFAHRQTGNG